VALTDLDEVRAAAAAAVEAAEAVGGGLHRAVSLTYARTRTHRPRARFALT
jgi:hypothetical protein